MHMARMRDTARAHVGVTTHLHRRLDLAKMKMPSSRDKCVKLQYGAKKITSAGSKMKPASCIGNTITCMIFIQVGHTQVVLGQVEDVIVTPMKINHTWACCDMIHVDNVFEREQY